MHSYTLFPRVVNTLVSIWFRLDRCKEVFERLPGNRERNVGASSLRATAPHLRRAPVVPVKSSLGIRCPFSNNRQLSELFARYLPIHLSSRTTLNFRPNSSKVWAKFESCPSETKT